MNTLVQKGVCEHFDIHKIGVWVLQDRSPGAQWCGSRYKSTLYNVGIAFEYDHSGELLDKRPGTRNEARQQRSCIAKFADAFPVIGSIIRIAFCRNVGKRIAHPYARGIGK